MFQVGLIDEGAVVDFGRGAVALGPVSGPQARILRELYGIRERGERMPKLRELAEVTGVTYAMASYHVRQLESKGFLERKPNAHAIRLCPIIQLPSSGVDGD